MTKPKPKRNKPMPRIEARFDALTFEDSRNIITKGAFFSAQKHPAKWSLSVTAEILDPSGLIDKRFIGLYANEEPTRLGALVEKLMPEIMPLFDDTEILKHIWIHAIKH